MGRSNTNDVAAIVAARIRQNPPPAHRRLSSTAAARQVLGLEGWTLIRRRRCTTSTRFRSTTSPQGLLAHHLRKEINQMMMTTFSQLTTMMHGDVENATTGTERVPVAPVKLKVDRNMMIRLRKPLRQTIFLLGSCSPLDLTTLLSFLVGKKHTSNVRCILPLCFLHLTGWTVDRKITSIRPSNWQATCLSCVTTQ